MSKLDQAQGLREAFATRVAPPAEQAVDPGLLLLCAGRGARARRGPLEAELGRLGARLRAEEGAGAPPTYVVLLVDADPPGVTAGLELLERVRTRWLLRGTGVAVNGVDAGSEGIAAYRGLVALAKSRNLDVQLDYLGHLREAAGRRRDFLKRDVSPAEFLLDLETGMPVDACIRFVARRAAAACPRGFQPNHGRLGDFWRALMGP